MQSIHHCNYKDPRFDKIEFDRDDDGRLIERKLREFEQSGTSRPPRKKPNTPHGPVDDLDLAPVPQAQGVANITAKTALLGYRMPGVEAVPIRRLDSVEGEEDSPAQIYEQEDRWDDRVAMLVDAKSSGNVAPGATLSGMGILDEPPDPEEPHFPTGARDMFAMVQRPRADCDGRFEGADGEKWRRSVEPILLGRQRRGWYFELSTPPKTQRNRAWYFSDPANKRTKLATCIRVEFARAGAAPRRVFLLDFESRQTAKTTTQTRFAIFRASGRLSSAEENSVFLQ